MPIILETLKIPPHLTGQGMGIAGSLAPEIVNAWPQVTTP